MTVDGCGSGCGLPRSAGEDVLVSGGPSKTWVLGNYLVTVTTPGGCGQCSSGIDSITSMVAMPTKKLSSGWGWGWAEVKVRRPSGNIAWTLRLQNEMKQEQPPITRDGVREGGAGVSRKVDEREEREEKGEGKENRQTAGAGGDVLESGTDQSPWQQTPFPWQLNIEDVNVEMWEGSSPEPVR